MFQILMSVLQEHTTAVLMLCAIIPRERITALVIRDIKETDENAKVNFIACLFNVIKVFQIIL